MARIVEVRGEQPLQGTIPQGTILQATLRKRVSNSGTNRREPKSGFVRFGPIADKRGRGRIVRFVPEADMPKMSSLGAGVRSLTAEGVSLPYLPTSLDYLIDAREHAGQAQMSWPSFKLE